MAIGILFLSLLAMYLVKYIIIFILLVILFRNGLKNLSKGIEAKRNPQVMDGHTSGKYFIFAALQILPLVLAMAIFVPSLISSFTNPEVEKDKELSVAYWEEHSEAPDSKEYTTDPEEYSKCLSKSLLEKVKSGDKDEVSRFFSKTAIESEGFDEQVERFMESCPKGKAEYVGSSYDFKTINYDNKNLSSEGSYYCWKSTVQIDRVSYYIYSYTCYRHSDPDEEGLVFFCIQDEKGNAKSIKKNTDYSSQTVVCEINK